MQGVPVRPETIQEVKVFLSSPTWTDFWLPMLKGMREVLLSNLADPSEERKKKEPDDFIRGQISSVTAFLELPAALVADYDQEEHRKEDVARKEQEYAERARTGHIGPFFPPTG